MSIVGKHADCFEYMELMEEACDMNCHAIMRHVDEVGPLEDYDTSKDLLLEAQMATLYRICQILKACGGSGLERENMRKIFKQEKLKNSTKMMSRICQVSLYSVETEKFYFKKYKNLLPYCKSFDVKPLKKLMKKR